MHSIVTFHAVFDHEWFDTVVQLLQSQYRLVPIDAVCDFYSGGPSAGACHITVDDGHRSFYEIILPVLKRRRVHASLFVSPRSCATRTNFWFQNLDQCDPVELKRIAAERLRLDPASLAPFSLESVCKALSIEQIEDAIARAARGVSSRPPFQNVSVDELLDIQRSGLVAIGAHTLSHPILTNETDSACYREMTGSVEHLASLLDSPVRYFAYPNGIPGLDFGAREEACAASSGIQLAFSTKSAHLARTDGRMRVPRIQISAGESPARIKAKLRLAGCWDAMKRLKRGGEYAERRRLNRLVRAVPTPRSDARGHSHRGHAAVAQEKGR